MGKAGRRVGDKGGYKQPAESKSHTKLGVTYHFPLIGISRATEPTMFSLVALNIQKKSAAGVNQRASRPFADSFLKLDTLLPRGC